jgi:hypothetical protein
VGGSVHTSVDQSGGWCIDGPQMAGVDRADLRGREERTHKVQVHLQSHNIRSHKRSQYHGIRYLKKKLGRNTHLMHNLASFTDAVKVHAAPGSLFLDDFSSTDEHIG